MAERMMRQERMEYLMGKAAQELMTERDAARTAATALSEHLSWALGYISSRHRPKRSQAREHYIAAQAALAAAPRPRIQGAEGA